MSTVGVKGGTVTSGAAPLVHLNRFLCEQVVTCSGHSKEHWVLRGVGGGGCTVGQVTSLTDSHIESAVTRVSGYAIGL